MRITNIRDLDGLSVTDTKRMRHPADLVRWEGLHRVDADRGVFRVFSRERKRNQECADEQIIAELD
jgi:hypothetical protein